MTLKYKYGIDEQGKDKEYNLQDKDFLLINAIDNLTKELNMARRNGV